MFEGPQNLDFELVWDRETAESLSTEEILAQCTGLPEGVVDCAPTHVEERLFTKEELRRITNVQSLDENDTSIRQQLKKRGKVLSPYVGSTLRCVFIRLPGVHYTIEIDPDSQVVVHLEWQVL